MVSSPLSRPRTPSKSPTPDDLPIPPIPQGDATEGRPAQRRPSFSFLRRAKSQERSVSMRSVSGRSVSGSKKLTKKQRKELEQQETIPSQPPKIPVFQRPPELQTFGGENARTNRWSKQYSSKSKGLPLGTMDLRKENVPFKVPIPPVPGQNGAVVDPYARTESMTHRGRYSYASSVISAVNSPRRVRRRKDPTPFNILVIGATNSGKTSFLDFLRTSLALPARKQRQTRAESIIGPTYTHIYPNYTSHYLETEMNDGERVGLTLWDSQGLEKGMVDLQLREMASFVEAKFEDTFNEEMKVVRSPGVQDTHIHCVFLILDPLRLDGNIAAARKKDRGTPNGTPYGKGNSFLEDQEGNTVPNALDEDLDLQVLRTLQGKTTVVPVISKADTITTAHMAYLKRAVWQSLKSANLDPLEGLGLDDDGDDERSEEGLEEESPVKATPENGHTHHNSKKFDERDEDNLLSATHNGNGISRSETSHLSSPTSSSSSASSPSPIDPSQHQPKPSTSSSNPPQYLPLSIISPDIHDPTTIGRRFPWGFADPYNPDHCDFVRLREAVFKEWRGELREASRELWYEGWRTSRLAGGRRGGNNSEVGAAF